MHGNDNRALPVVREDDLSRVNTAFFTVNGFVGVMARYVNASNHYYVVLYRDKAALRKRVNGVPSTIKEVPYTITLGAPYRLRLEAFGSSLRFYVNDTLMAEGQDDTLPTGRYGLITFNAADDFDNFRVIRPKPLRADLSPNRMAESSAPT